MSNLWTLVLVALAVCQPIAAMTWKECSDGVFAPKTVTLTPDPPQVGEKISFDIKGDYPGGAHLLLVIWSRHPAAYEHNAEIGRAGFPYMLQPMC